jgi:hypothetical protein
MPLRDALERHGESHAYDGVPPTVPLGSFRMFRGIFRQLW